MAATNTSPFVDEFELESLQNENGMNNEQIQNYASYSPFYSNEADNEFEGEWESDPKANQYFEMLAELHDNEFETAVDNLVMELQEHVANFEANSPFANEAQTTQLAQNYLQPLIVESQRLFEAMANEMEAMPVDRMSEMELEAALDNVYTQRESNFTPAQEFFLKKLANKAKAVIKKVANVAKKASPVHQILKRLAPIVEPMFKRILDKVLGRLPAEVRDIARTFANKLFKRKNVEPIEDSADGTEQNADSSNNTEDQNTGSEGEAPSTYLSQNIQAELDHFLSRMSTTDNEAEFENIANEYEQLANTEYEQVNFEAAKEQFVKDLNNLKEGEDPTPALENFLPAALKAAHMIVKTGIKFIGREKVVSFLANLLAKWIAKYIGEEKAKKLSMVLADKGLKLMRLEAAEPENDARPVYEAIAHTVEEVANKVSNFSEEVLNNEELFSQETYQAFEQAAAAYFPDNAIRNEARESETGDGHWQNKGKYLKYSKVFETKLTASQLKNVKTFGGIGLDAFIRDTLGIKINDGTNVKIHLYQAKKGSTISGIALAEKGVPGLGTASRAAYNQLHVLTKEAAASLLGQIGLGKNVRPVENRNRNLIFEGERFFYLQMLNNAAVVTANTDDSTDVNQVVNNGNGNNQPSPVDVTPTQRSTQLHRIITGSLQGGIVIKDMYYFSEADSRNIADALRKQSLTGIYEFVKKIRPNFIKNFFGDKYKVGNIVLKGLLDIVDKLIKENVSKVVLAKIKHHIEDFDKAVKDPKHGVTVVITYRIGFDRGKTLKVRVQDVVQSATINIFPGFTQKAKPRPMPICPNCGGGQNQPNGRTFYAAITPLSPRSFPITKPSFN